MHDTGICDDEDIDSNDECVLDHRFYRTFLVVFELNVIALQLFLICCLFINRKRLAHKVINIYAVNAVVANMMSSVSNFINSLYGYIGNSSIPLVYSNETHSANDSDEMKLWFFLRTFQGVMLLALPFSLALLVGAIQSNLFEIHHMVVGESPLSASENEVVLKSFRHFIKRFNGQVSRINKKKKALILIALNWVFPIFFAVISMFDNQCLHHCRCGFHYVIKDRLDIPPCPLCKDCHILWYPGSNSAFQLLSIAWILLTIIDACLLIYSFVKFSRVRKDHKNAVMSVSRVGKRRSLKVNVNSDKVDDEKITAVTSSKAEVTSYYDEVALTNTSEVDKQFNKQSTTINPIPSNDKDIKQTAPSEQATDVNNKSLIGDDEPEFSLVLSNRNETYEEVTLSSIFLLERLKKKLFFLSLVILVVFLGYGGVVICSWVLIYYPKAIEIESSKNNLALFLPAIIAEGINAVLLCNTTAALRMAIVSTLRRIFHKCYCGAK